MKIKIIAIAVVLLTMSHVVIAQTTGSVVNQNIVACPTIILTQGERLKNDFYDSLRRQAQSSEASSNRIGNIFAQYRDFQTRFNEITGQNFLYNEDISQSANLKGACQQYHQATLAMVREVLTETYQQVLHRKQIFVLNERLDLILDQMDELQDEFHTSRSNLNKFDDKFGCYLSQCIKN